MSCIQCIPKSYAIFLETPCNVTCLLSPPRLCPCSALSCPPLCQVLLTVWNYVFIESNSFKVMLTLSGTKERHKGKFCWRELKRCHIYSYLCLKAAYNPNFKLVAISRVQPARLYYDIYSGGLGQLQKSYEIKTTKRVIKS